jgi:hypothetical protein
LPRVALPRATLPRVVLHCFASRCLAWVFVVLHCVVCLLIVLFTSSSFFIDQGPSGKSNDCDPGPSTTSKAMWGLLGNAGQLLDKTGALELFTNTSLCLIPFNPLCLPCQVTVLGVVSLFSSLSSLYLAAWIALPFVVSCLMSCLFLQPRLSRLFGILSPKLVNLTCV